MQLVLASSSPRRHDLLALLRIPFEVQTPTFEEQLMPGLPPLDQVAQFALRKAQSVAIVRPEALVLGSDTIVELDGSVLGKPRDLQEARTMLTRMVGRSHLVRTAAAFCWGAMAIESVEVATTTVRMKMGDNQTLERYLATGESLGKAGSYSIQGLGGDLVERIDGDFTTVVGLPLKIVARLLRDAGYLVPCDVEELYREKPYRNWSRFSV
jgi:septum formation protein